jgi:hypothetical protein
VWACGRRRQDRKEERKNGEEKEFAESEMVDIQGLQLESPHFVCVDSDD